MYQAVCLKYIQLISYILFKVLLLYIFLFYTNKQASESQYS